DWGRPQYRTSEWLVDIWRRGSERSRSDFSQLRTRGYTKGRVSVPAVVRCRVQTLDGHQGHPRRGKMATQYPTRPPTVPVLPCVSLGDLGHQKKLPPER